MTLREEDHGLTRCGSKELETQKKCDNYDDTHRLNGSIYCFHFRDWEDEFYVCDYVDLKGDKK